MHLLSLAALVVITILPACNRSDQQVESATKERSIAGSMSNVTNAWLGRWTGPEGTFLEISADGSDYLITIQNLDGARKFAGKRAGEEIRFERDGINESIKAGSGAQTGMKWLQDKSNCLVVKAGEGYCRG
jgi:hypothetical protein